VYGYIVVDDIDTPTTESVYFVYFDNATDLEVLVTNLSTQQDGTATNLEVIVNVRANLSNVPEDFGLNPIALEAAIDLPTTLQQAYNAGQAITLVDSKGDLIITLDDSGTAADLSIIDGGGNYITTDAANNTLDLGSATNQVDVNGNFAVTGAYTFNVGTGQADFAGNLDANAGLDVTGTTNLGDGGATNYAQFGATGDLSFVGAADTISKSDAALNIQTAAQALNITTVGSGTLAVGSAGVLDLDGASVTLDSAGALSIDAAGATNVTVTGNNLTLSTLSSGNVILDSIGEITFGDAHWLGTGSVDPLPFSDASNTTFTGSATGAISLIDAINQVAAVTANAMSQADSVPGAVARDTDVTIPGGLVYVAGADFVSDFLIFVNGVKMRNGINAAANYDVYPGSAVNKIRFEFKINATDIVSAIKIA
jgi:hypothetical protein